MCLAGCRGSTPALCQKRSSLLWFAEVCLSFALYLTALLPCFCATFCLAAADFQGPVKRAGAMFTIGVVGRCLSKALVQSQGLTPQCRQLVLIAAPKDSRVYLQYPESASALVQKIAELQRAAGAGKADHVGNVAGCGGVGQGLA